MSALAEWLTEQLERRHLSQRALAAYSGISVATVNSLLKGTYKPSSRTLEKLAHHFNEPREKIYQLAGLLPPESELNVVEEEALYLFRQLGSVEQKRILQSMRAWLEDNGKAHREGEGSPS